MYIDDRLTDDRPLISKISNGHISATGDPIHFMFGSRLGFSGTADLMALFPVRKIQDGGRRHLEKISNGRISATGRPIHFMFASRVGFSGTADLMSLFLPTTCTANLICLRKQHHITSLLMRKTLELDIVWESTSPIRQEIE